MDTTLPMTIAVQHAGLTCAVCTNDRVRLAPHIEALGPQHPAYVMVAAKCLIAEAFLLGEVDGTYDDQLATDAARLLIADRNDS